MILENMDSLTDRFVCETTQGTANPKLTVILNRCKKEISNHVDFLWRIVIKIQPYSSSNFRFLGSTDGKVDPRFWFHI